MNIFSALPTDLKRKVTSYFPVGPRQPFIHQLQNPRPMDKLPLKQICSVCERYKRVTRKYNYIDDRLHSGNQVLCTYCEDEWYQESMEVYDRLLAEDRRVNGY